MKKILLITILFAGFVAVTKAQTPNAKEIIDAEQGEEIVEDIDYMYGHLSNPKDEIFRYIQSLEPSVQKEDISEFYLARFRQACKDEESENILHDAQIYLLLGEDEGIEEVYSLAAKAATALGRDNSAKQLVEEMRNYSALNDNWLDEEVAVLERELMDIRRERKRMEREANWNEGVKGTWVAIDYEDGKLMMVDINSPSSRSGAELIYPDRKIKTDNNGGRLSSYKPYTRLGRSQSIRFDGYDRAISMQFASQEIKDRSWLEGVSKTGLESTRDFRTATNTYIRTSDDDWKTQLAYSAAVDLTTGLLDAIFVAMTTSSRTEEFYSLSMAAVSTDVMRGEIYHNGTTIYSDGRVDKWANKTCRHLFVRWEVEDSIVFVSNNGNPLINGSVEENSPVLKDYKELKWYSSFFNPDNLVPKLFGFGIGAWLCYRGAMIMANTLGSEKLVPRVRGTFMMVTGFTIFLPILSFSIDGMKKTDMDYLNKKNLDKLKRKAKTDLSFAPTYYPENNALGASLNLSF